ncbi:MAG: hypothetical protein NXI27_21810 [Alphaproteobacteria bacterium]|nr:hypothetical protein [Alphaproteobacteria bacterium]
MRTLERARSLETFMAPYRHDNILYDPTGVFERASKLLRIAGEIRAELNGAVDKLLWQGDKGALIVVLNQGNASDEGRFGDASPITIETSIRAILSDVCDQKSSDFIRAVRVGYSVPNVAATPIDQQSLTSQDGVLEWLKSKTGTSALAALIGVGAVATAPAQDTTPGRAVSGVNGEWGLIGGSLNGDTAFMTEGALTFPISHQFGARLDGTLGARDGHFLGGAAAHFFWRDPDKGLLGVAGGFANADTNSATAGSSDVGAFVGEGELYLENLTVSGLAGYQFSDGAGNDGFLGRLDFEWYATDDLLLTAGAETNPVHDLLGRVGVEYRPGFDALPGLSFFADGAFGENDFYRAYGGIRLYFGSSTTLKDRHRRDTFRSHLFSTRLTDSVPSVAYGD